MTKEVFLICAAVAFWGALMGFFAKQSERGAFKKIIDLAVGIFLLVIILNSFKVEMTETPAEENNLNLNYEKISDEIFEKILSEAEEKTEETIVLDICTEYNIGNVDCEVLINRDYEVEHAIVYIELRGKHISNYEIKNYLKQKYDMDVEVVSR